MRHLFLGDKGTDVTDLQRALNERAAARQLPKVNVDGQYGPDTDRSVDRVSRLLGVLEETIQQNGCTVGQQRVIRWPTSRNPSQYARARSRAKADAAQRAREKAAQPYVHDNTVTGGTGSERVVAGARKALSNDLSGKRQSFYSQPGTWTVNHTITGEKPGERSDCSQFATALHHSSGLIDPNANDYNGGYTGTLANACTKISTGQLHDGDLVIWDPYGPQGHVAVVEDASQQLCIGHGSRHPARHRISDFAYKPRQGFYRRPGG